MASNTAGITVGCAETTVVVAVRGPGNLFNSYPLQVFLATMLEASAEHFVVDLSECTHLDSTFMGVMAGLSQRLRAAGRDALCVANATPPTLEIMQRLGLNHLVDLQEMPVPALESATTLNPVDLSKLQRGRHMLHAHLELSALSEANRDQFAQLISTLKSNVATHRGNAEPR